MIKLNKSQSKWLQAVYNKAYTESNDNAFSLTFAANLYNATRLNPNFKSIDGEMVGIASLPKDTEGVDSSNTEDALSYAVQRDLNKYIQADGDPSSIGDPEMIEVIEQQLDAELFGNDDTFTGIESRENRFKKSMKSNNTEALGQMIDELMQDRVTQRTKVLADGA